MDITAFESAYEDFFAVLRRHGYTKEASEIEAQGFGLATPTAPAPTSEAPVKGDMGRFEEEKPPQKPASQKPVYRGQPGSAAPVLELSRIIDHVEQSPSFKKLPPDVTRGLLKIKKMTGNAFKYASEKEALFGMKEEPAKELQKALLKFDKANPLPRKLPDDVKRALNNLNTLVTQYVDSLPQEKSILEKGKDVARGVAEKGQGVLEKGKDVARGIAEKGQGVLERGKDVARGVAEKGQGIIEKGKDVARGVAERGVQKNVEQFNTDERQQSAFGALKKSLFNYKTYRDIFYRLPPQIIKALEGIGLGIDNIDMSTAKVAHQVNRTLLNYIRTKEAYSSKELSLGKKDEKEHLDVYETFATVLKRKGLKSPMTKDQFAVSIAKAHLKEDPKYYTKLKETFKESMDFSGIGNLLTPEGKLDERELSRVIRLAIAAELDATHLYELIVDSSDDETVKKVLQSISNEEKVHASELNELLDIFDKENKKFVEDGKKEVEGLIK
jgi:hypothetical protein